MTDSELYWLAGLLEGEGSFQQGPPSAPKSPRIVLQMTDEDVVARAAKLLGVACVPYPARQVNWKPTFVCRLTGNRAVIVMQQLHPIMGTRRQQQIDKALSCWKPREPKVTPEQKAEIQTLLNQGVTQRDIAVRFGISQPAVSYIKLGSRPSRLTGLV